MIFLKRTLILFFLPFSLYANEHKAHKQLELMEFAFKEEKKYSVDPAWARISFPDISLFSKAYAYRDGESCLILGFQSTFKNGMCRLSLASEAKALRPSCDKGKLPCNPVVFGEKENNKPFCVPTSLGPELSKYCAYQVFNNINEQGLASESQKILNEIKRKGPKAFDFNKAKGLTEDEKFSEKFLSHYKDDEAFDKAQNFTKNLCHSIKASTNNHNQKADLSNCEAILTNFELKDATVHKTTEAKKQEETKLNNEKKPVIKDKVVQNEKEVKKKENIFIDLSERKCEIPDSTVVVEEKKVQDIKNITQTLEAQSWVKCANELYYHKDLNPDFRGKYWHDIDNEKFFAKQCWNLDNYGQTEMIYTFLSDSGFKILKFPVHKYQENGVTATLPRNIYKFKNGNKEHYISVYDMIGEYFDSLPEKDFSKFLTEKDRNLNPTSVQNRYIKPYESFLSKNFNYKTPELKAISSDDDLLDGAKECIKKRFVEYAQFIINKRDPEAIPYRQSMNADVNGLNRRDPATLTKYQRSVEEIRKQHTEAILHPSSSCLDILSKNDIAEAFDKNFSSRYEQYERYHKISNP